MNRFSGYRTSFAASAFVLSVVGFASHSQAAEPAVPLPTRPYYCIYATSIDRLLAICKTVFDSVDRPDLASSLQDRLKGFRDFSGIDRTKPLGTMWTWGDVSQAEILFLPVKDRDELMKTATFEIVGFHEAGPDQYEIERPGSPYHVLFRNDYAYFADSPSAIQALRVAPDALTRGLRDRYDCGIFLDLKQLPRPAKIDFVEQLESQIEPWLQEQDNEAAETAKLRKTLGKLTLGLIRGVVLDTNTAIIGGHLDLETHTISCEVILEAAKGSLLEAGLNRLVARRSEFTSLVSPDVPAGVAINLPLGGIIEQILEPSGNMPTKGSRLEAGLQLVSTGLGHFSIIVALRGPETAALNNAIPDWLIKLEESHSFSKIFDSFDIHHEIVLHRLLPREIPAAIIQLVGPEAEIVVGQGGESLWLAIGSPESLTEKLKEAIDLVENSRANGRSGPLVRARFQARQLPELVTSDADSRAAFDRGGDGFSLTIEPITSGLKLRIEAEEGFIRLIGREWVKQIHTPTE